MTVSVTVNNRLTCIFILLDRLLSYLFIAMINGISNCIEKHAVGFKLHISQRGPSKEVKYSVCVHGVYIYIYIYIYIRFENYSISRILPFCFGSSTTVLDSAGAGCFILGFCDRPSVLMIASR